MTDHDQKLRLLYIVRILEEETDENHCLTGPQFIEKLQERGVDIERKTLYDDIDCLKEFGFDIQNTNHKKGWCLASRRFDRVELRLLSDAVQSSRFLQTRKSKTLVEKIGEMGSKYERKGLTRSMFVSKRIKNQNDSVVQSLDTVQRAIDQKKQITFTYRKYNEELRLVSERDGEDVKKYSVSPLHLLYKDEFYYLIAIDDNDEGKKIKNYRLDRMKKIENTDLDATETEETKRFSIQDYQKGMFFMFGGTKVLAKMKVCANVMSSVVDIFGKENIILEESGDGWSIIAVDARLSPTFYSWLAQFKDTITLLGPDSAKSGYTGFLRDAIRQYT